MDQSSLGLNPPLDNTISPSPAFNQPQHQSQPPLQSQPAQYQSQPNSSSPIKSTPSFILLPALTTAIIYSLIAITLTFFYNDAGNKPDISKITAPIIFTIVALLIITLFGKKLLVNSQSLSSRQKITNIAIGTIFSTIVVFLLYQITPIEDLSYITLLVPFVSLSLNLIIYGYHEIINLPEPFLTSTLAAQISPFSKIKTLALIDILIISICPSALFIAAILSTAGLLLMLGFAYLPAMPFTTLALILFSAIPFQKFARKKLIYLTRLYARSSLKFSIISSLAVASIIPIYGLLTQVFLARNMDSTFFIDTIDFSLPILVIILIFLTLTKLYFLSQYKKLIKRHA